MRTSRTARSSAGLVLAGSLVLAACGGSPTASPTASGGGASEAEEDCFAETREELDDIYAQLEGLSMDERKEKLQELAADKGSVTIAASTNPDDAKVTYPAFTEATGVEVELQSGDADTSRARLAEEIDACFGGVDMLIANVTEVAPLDREGWLLPLESPAIDSLPEDARLPGNFVSDTYNVYAAAWNTNNVSPEEAPSTWEEVLAFEEGFATDVGDYAWFGTLVMDYFMEEKGMTEEEAVDLFREASTRAVPIDGHTLMVQLLSAGEFDLIANGYHHSIQREADAGAPIAWRDPAPVEPVVVRPGGTAIPITTDNLPGALLYLDWTLSEEKAELNASMNRTPVLPVEGGIPEDIERLRVSDELILDPAAVEKWKELYEEVIRQTGQEVIAE